jgi:hypothetical protein
MRILYLSSAASPDYQCDMAFHGLRRLLGPDIVDVNRLWYMYADEFSSGKNKKCKLYGRGFSIYGFLESDSAVDRTDIRNKIRHRYYDFIVYGSIRRCNMFLDDVFDAYSPTEIAFIGGEDDSSIFTPILGRGLYFKRELTQTHPLIRPIQFAIPADRVGSVQREKLKIIAFVDPRDRASYIYEKEEDYYSNYAESLFAVTTKKGGWDCLRHYEIMANTCIPYFIALENCPSMTMTFLPKYELWRAGTCLADKGPTFFETSEGRALWTELQRRIEKIFRRYLTTEALARYFLARIMAPNSQTVGLIECS